MDRFKKNMCKALKRGLEGGKMVLPAGGQQLMEAFLALSRARTMGPVGPNPITWEALASWMQVMRVPLAPHHADIIMALDDVWMAHAFNRSTPSGVKTLPPISQHPINAALLDAVLG